MYLILFKTNSRGGTLTSVGLPCGQFHGDWSSDNYPSKVHIYLGCIGVPIIMDILQAFVANSFRIFFGLKDSLSISSF